MIPQHFSTQELAERLSVHPETLRRAAQRGELKPVRIGRDLRWPEDDVSRWLAQRRVDNSRVLSLVRASGGCEDAPNT